MVAAAVLAASLAGATFFGEPIPVEMPRAEAYLVNEGGTRRLEDRYEIADLWFSETVLGQWMDGDGRGFTLARLAYEAPAAEGGTTRTRVSWLDMRRKLDRKDRHALHTAIDRLSPVDLPEEGERLRQLPRGCEEARYWQGTNLTAIVCAFRPVNAETWLLACWELASGDDFDEAREVFEERFLDARAWSTLAPFRKKGSTREAKPRKTARTEAAREREALRDDAHHAVACYDEWRWADDEAYTVLDALGPNRSFVSALTNELARMRPRYAATVPTLTDSSNILCVARIFPNRDSYLDAVDDDLRWTAAYWSPSRREIVAYLPEGGSEELLRTFRHEAFHQYLSYATCMIPVSPWLNEGYAQYFEREPDAAFDSRDLAAAAPSVPALLAMDYEAFYGGTDAERRFKYRLAHAIVRFIEKGAPKVRFRPFDSLKADYFKALFQTKDMSKATSAAFRNADNLALFVSEWQKFYLSE